jgi:hypothetical protein
MARYSVGNKSTSTTVEPLFQRIQIAGGSVWDGD